MTTDYMDTQPCIVKRLGNQNPQNKPFNISKMIREIKKLGPNEE